MCIVFRGENKFDFCICLFIQLIYYFINFSRLLLFEEEDEKPHIN